MASSTMMGHCWDLAIGGFRPKAIEKSGHNLPEELEKLGPVLGHMWSPDSDMISFSFSLKCKTTKSKEEKVTPDNIDTIVLTRRHG